jgi:hypothetical protein
MIFHISDCGYFFPFSLPKEKERKQKRKKDLLGYIDTLMTATNPVGAL